MKKNFFKKKLTSTLALALVATSISIPNYSFAATTTKIVKQNGKAAPSIVYVGGSKVDLNLNKTYKSNSYTWTVSNSKIATVTSKTGVVTAKAPGVVTVKCTVRNAKTKKWLKAYTKKVRVNLRATSIDIGADDFELMTGATKDLNAVKTPAKSTDAVRYYSDNKDVATVNPTTGVVTAVNPGTATITVYSKATAKTATTSKYNKTDSVKVTVPVGITKVAQTKAAQLKATFNTDAKDVKASDFTIVNDETKQVYSVKEVSASGKDVTITTFLDMTDGKTYTVTYKEKQYQFTATNNVVSSLAFSTVTVPYAKATAVKLSKLDANGVELGNYEYGKVTDSNLEFKIEPNSGSGYMTGEKLYLFKIGDTAKATAVYHTYKYDDKYNEVGVVKAEATITAVDQTAVTLKDTKYTISTSKPYWDTLTSSNNNTRLAVGDNSTLWFYAKNSDDTVAGVGDYTFESSDKNVLLVDTDASTSDLKAKLYAPKAVGSAYVLVKDQKGKTVASLLVNIVGSKNANRIEFDKPNVTISNTSKVVDTQTIKVTVKDQYNDDMSLNSYKDKIAIKVPNGAPSATFDKATGLITITDAQGKATGSYTYTVTCDGNLPRNFTVNVVDGNNNGSVSYDLVLNQENIDTKFDGSDSSSKVITVKAAVLKGGRLYDYATLTTGDVTVKKDNKDVTASAYTVSGNTITFNALTVNGTKVTKQDIGTYVVTVKFTYDGKDQNLTKGFYVADTQTKAQYKQKETTVEVTGNTSEVATQKAALIKAFEFTYEGSKVDVSVDSITNLDAKYLGNTINYASCYVDVQINGKDGKIYTVPMKVVLDNRSVTIK